jgi:hypothetical protein
MREFYEWNRQRKRYILVRHYEELFKWDPQTKRYVRDYRGKDDLSINF